MTTPTISLRLLALALCAMTPQLFAASSNMPPSDPSAPTEEKKTMASNTLESERSSSVRIHARRPTSVPSTPAEPLTKPPVKKPDEKPELPTSSPSKPQEAPTQPEVSTQSEPSTSSKPPVKRSPPPLPVKREGTVSGLLEYQNRQARVRTQSSLIRPQNTFSREKYIDDHQTELVAAVTSASIAIPVTLEVQRVVRKIKQLKGINSEPGIKKETYGGACIVMPKEIAPGKLVWTQQPVAPETLTKDPEIDSKKRALYNNRIETITEGMGKGSFCVTLIPLPGVEKEEDQEEQKDKKPYYIQLSDADKLKLAHDKNISQASLEILVHFLKEIEGDIAQPEEGQKVVNLKPTDAAILEALPDWIIVNLMTNFDFRTTADFQTDTDLQTNPGKPWLPKKMLVTTVHPGKKPAPKKVSPGSSPTLKPATPPSKFSKLFGRTTSSSTASSTPK